ncbi:MAG: hypothetical protein JWO31_443, partial [Phycisphaerales bacterium]|nr:hypothetical protein [Phycisphaerales bacterium]
PRAVTPAARYDDGDGAGERMSRALLEASAAERRVLEQLRGNERARPGP